MINRRTFVRGLAVGSAAAGLGLWPSRGFAQADARKSPGTLTGTEFELLALLAGSPHRVFSRDEILERLRGRSAEDIASRAVDILVSRLRRKLEPLDCIHTLRNAGYTFAGVRV